ncbi:enoyl-CoA hydratase/isomerase family protein [Leekyejoonella antrihumi]|uniref:Enoyl-CoA hydratase/isomerase family protein n=1 Tax=Leekyejoonella antrihumi TaxID=1660198 RepID=A0A563E6I4_9MICO|nr:enoyl-CoA hydratase/isomerase family protein [Leekyejoonella antrihumi]
MWAPFSCCPVRRVRPSNMARTRDFDEGVRALLVDKDHAPQWEHASVAEVPREVVTALFE